MRFPLIRVILVVLGLAAIGFGGPLVKREAGYHSILKSYSRDLKPGMSRKQVEDYLEAKGVSFGHLCCIDERSAYADVTLIGQDRVLLPFCSTKYVSIAFQFAATEPHDRLEAYPSDALKSITFFRTYDCV